MDLEIKKLTLQEGYEVMGKLIGEINLRKSSTRTFLMRDLMRVTIGQEEVETIFGIGEKKMLEFYGFCLYLTAGVVPRKIVGNSRCIAQPLYSIPLALYY